MSADREADAEFFFSAKELAQAMADYLCKTGRVEGQKGTERTLITFGLAGEPTSFKLWWRQ